MRDPFAALEKRQNKKPSIHREGLSLIEVMIAMTMTLIVLTAMMAAFRTASSEISKGRAMIELSNQLRMAQEEMRNDLEGITVDMRPWAISSSPNGYFEYIEGGQTDKSVGTANVANAVIGDIDDIIAMTVRGNGRQFRGRMGPQTVTSPIAEVIWWTNFTDRDADGGLDYDESLRLYRRVLMIRPEMGQVPAPNIAAVRAFFLLNDVSMRWVDNDSDGNRDTLIANTLEDLAKRENRFAHWSNWTYPYLLDRAEIQNCQLAEANIVTTLPLVGFSAAQVEASKRFIGSDIKLSDVIGFDVQVFSSNAPIGETNNIAVTPNDIGVGVMVDQGSFIDLGYANTPFDPTATEFATLPTLKSLLSYADPVGISKVLDTFSKHYESNGIDDNLDGNIDEGMNGLDDDSANGVDDNGERETMPPYPFRIKGIKVSFRIVDRTTKQIRQTSVVHSFMPH